MITITKVKLALEDVLFGFGVIPQTRNKIVADYTQINSTHLPHTVGTSVADEINDRRTNSENDVVYSPILGDAAQVFMVAIATEDEHAIPRVQLDAEVLLLDSAKAEKSNVLELDNSSPYTPSFNYNPATSLFVQQQVAALEANTLLKNNTVIFTPLSDYQPSTKKYVDDTVAENNVPVGCVVVYSGVTGSDVMGTDWQLCDGVIISNASSPLDGQNTPDYSAETLTYYIRLT